MSEKNKLIERKPTELIKEKSQYVIAFGVIAAMLYITGFPMFVIFFFGILAFFIWKTLSAPPMQGIRGIFEFYLQANDILRDDDRRWYGFEIEEVVARGERIIKTMKGAPPLVNFTVGALYAKMGDFRSAEEHLAFVTENSSADEKAFVNPSNELREYVKMLRKIEREPAESPLTSTAVRALERARKNRAKTLLEQARDAIRQEEFRRVEAEVDGQTPRDLLTANEGQSAMAMITESRNRETPKAQNHPVEPVRTEEKPPDRSKSTGRRKDRVNDDAFGNRKPISEVLRDIYDTN